MFAARAAATKARITSPAQAKRSDLESEGRQTKRQVREYHPLRPARERHRGRSSGAGRRAARRPDDLARAQPLGKRLATSPCALARSTPVGMLDRVVPASVRR